MVLNNIIIFFKPTLSWYIFMSLNPNSSILLVIISSIAWNGSELYNHYYAFIYTVIQSAEYHITIQSSTTPCRQVQDHLLNTIFTLITFRGFSNNFAHYKQVSHGTFFWFLATAEPPTLIADSVTIQNQEARTTCPEIRKWDKRDCNGLLSVDIRAEYLVDPKLQLCKCM